MKQLILIRGLSGSGKTTLADTICGDNENRFMVSVDDYFVDENGVYKFNHEAFKDAHGWCQKECVEAMEEGFEVIVIHNTFTRKWECEPYMELALQNGYAIQVLNLYDGGLSDRELSERGQHNVPPHVIQKQRKRWDKDVYRDKRPTLNQYHHPHFNPYHRPRGNYNPNNNRGKFYKRDSRW